MIPPKRFDIFPPDWGMLKRSRCVKIFLLKLLLYQQGTRQHQVGNDPQEIKTTVSCTLETYFLRTQSTWSCSVPKGTNELLLVVLAKVIVIPGATYNITRCQYKYTHNRRGPTPRRCRPLVHEVLGFPPNPK